MVIYKRKRAARPLYIFLGQILFTWHKFCFDRSRMLYVMMTDYFHSMPKQRTLLMHPVSYCKSACQSFAADLVFEPHIKDGSGCRRRLIIAPHLNVSADGAGEPGLLTNWTIDQDMWEDDDGGER